MINSKIEIWVKVNGYNDYYQVSNMGRIMSNNRISKNRILKQYVKRNGYVQVALQDGSKVRWKLLSRLVYESFIGNTDLQIDHINEIKTDNRLCNLQAISCSDNNIKAKRHNKTSKFPGVYLYNNGKWKAQIGINGKKISLGYFAKEEDAYLAYKKARP